MKETHVLITNLRYVTINSVRVHANALLLSCSDNHLFGGRDAPPRLSLRAFGPDPAWETMDMIVPSIEYTIKRTESRDIFIGDSGKSRPLFTGAIIQIGKDGPRLDVMRDDDEADFAVDSFSEIMEVWAALPRRVEEFWTAPYILTMGNRPSMRQFRRPR